MLNNIKLNNNNNNLELDFGENGLVVLDENDFVIGWDLNLEFGKELGIVFDEFESIENDIKFNLFKFNNLYNKYY